MYYTLACSTLLGMYKIPNRMEGMQICFIQFLGCTYLEGKSVYCIVLYSSIHDEKKKLLVPL